MAKKAKRKTGKRKSSKRKASKSKKPSKRSRSRTTYSRFDPNKPIRIQSTGHGGKDALLKQGKKTIRKVKPKKIVVRRTGHKPYSYPRVVNTEPKPTKRIVKKKGGE